MNEYRKSQINTKTFFPISVEKQLNSLQGKKLACAKMAPRKVEERARSGHVTGQRSLRGRGSRKRTSKGTDKHNAFLGLSFS